MKIYSSNEARETILKRKPLFRAGFSDETIRRTEQVFGSGVRPPQAIAEILASVESEGDQALRKWTRILDMVDLHEFFVPPERLEAAWRALPNALRDALETAAGRIRSFHSRQPVESWFQDGPDGRLGQRVAPLQRVGVYVPGGTAPLPSSLLMSVIPAQVAGVRDILVATPPGPSPAILAAAHLCGLETVLQVGGAQAIAAMAFGTESVPRVDKVVGAGSLFVTLAKQQLYGVVGLDGLAGPTETVVIADSSANPDWVAADLLAQAEHDVLATAILLTPDAALAAEVQQQVALRLKGLSRREIITASVANNGGIVITESLEEAADLAGAYAAEHLCLSVAGPEALMERIPHAGGFFLGDHSFEVLGDYVAGPSHIMPTGGTARFASPLNVLDFVKISSVIALEPDAARSLAPTAAEIAAVEGLTAHESASRARLGATA